VSAAELLALHFSPPLPMKKDGGELIGPTMTIQGSFGDRRTRHKLAGIRDSVTGWAKVAAGKGECRV
jgi:hypothetical protein